MAESFHEFQIDTLTEAFDIHSVDEKFCAGSGQCLESFLGDSQGRELLPAIGDYKVFAIADAAAQVEHEAFFIDELDELREARFIQAAFPENPRGDDDMRSPGIEIAAGIGGIDAAADMQAARISAERFLRGGFIARTEHDDVTAFQSVTLIEFCIPRAGAFGDEIGTQTIAAVGEGAADNLLHFSIVQIDTRTKHGGDVRT